MKNFLRSSLFLLGCTRVVLREQILAFTLRPAAPAPAAKYVIRPSMSRESLRLLRFYRRSRRIPRFTPHGIVAVRPFTRGLQGLHRLD